MLSPNAALHQSPTLCVRGPHSFTCDAEIGPPAKRARRREFDETMSIENELLSSSTLLSPDDILIQMIKQSGAKSYDEIVQFCLSSGIPLSRMLRLDLMRLIR